MTARELDCEFRAEAPTAAGNRHYRTLAQRTLLNESSFQRKCLPAISRVTDFDRAIARGQFSKDFFRETLRGKIIFEFDRFDERLAIFASHRFRDARQTCTGKAAMRDHECFERRLGGNRRSA